MSVLETIRGRPIHPRSTYERRGESPAPPVHDGGAATSSRKLFSSISLSQGHALTRTWLQLLKADISVLQLPWAIPKTPSDATTSTLSPFSEFIQPVPAADAKKKRCDVQVTLLSKELRINISHEFAATQRESLVIQAMKGVLTDIEKYFPYVKYHAENREKKRVRTMYIA